MNKPFGAQGKISNFPFKDLHETFYNEQGVEIEVKEGALFVGVDNVHHLEQAKSLAHLYLASWAVRHNLKISTDFNHEWKTIPQGNKDHFIGLQDGIQLIDRVQTQSVTHQVSFAVQAHIIGVQPHDSGSFTNENTIVLKALKYPALKNALTYYSEEVVDDKRPLYGVYKALEAMTDYLDPNEKEGRKKLAQLARKPFSYVDDVMQTTQVKRHHITKAIRKMSDEECRQRAKILIDAFASSLQ
jgi:hypothetical protein